MAHTLGIVVTKNIVGTLRTRKLVRLDAVLRGSIVGAFDAPTATSGWLATVVFYGLNNLQLEAAYDLVVAVGSSATSYEDAASLLTKWHQPLTA